MNSIHAAIVGAGPYGLSLAAHLRAADVTCEVLGQPMHSWASRMPHGMILRSEPFASSLWDPARRYTYERYCLQHGLAYEPVGLPPSRDRFLEYARWFQREAVGPIRGGLVRSVKRAPDGFAVTMEDGRPIAARNVILATGYMAFRHVPPELAALRWPMLVHSAMMDDVASYAGQDVAVVGAGQSALESAALLHEAGARVRILARREKIKWNGGPKRDRTWLDRVAKPHAGLGAGWKDLAISELPQVFRALFPAEKRHRYVRDSWGPSGSWWLRERVDGRIETRLQCTPVTARAERGKAVIEVRENGSPATSLIEADRVISATGFRVDLARLEYLDPALVAEVEREAEAPKLDASYQTSVPGLYVIGAASAPTFGPVMRFMFGAKHAAPMVARRLRRGA
jgi:thioredoxin reductase